MKFSFLFILTSLVPAVAATIPSSFRPLGNTIVGSPVQPFEFGSIVKLSDDGSRMAIGAASKEGGAIFLYEREVPTDAEDFARESHWSPIFETFEKGLGKSLELSGNGDYLVFRKGSNEIHTFHVPSNGILGVPLTTTCPVFSLKIGTTSSSSVFGEAQWLLVGCNTFDDKRGKVEMFRLTDHTWVHVFTLTGSHPQARFGWDLGFYSDYDLITVAVSSPHFRVQTGMVQLFLITSQGYVSQFGSDIIGQAATDQFGIALALSRAGNNPWLVVGAPSCSNVRGCVAVYKWGRPSIGETFDWILVGEPLIGDNIGDRFGRTLVISKSGERFAAGSYHYNVHTGLIKVYERSNNNSIDLVGELKGQAFVDRWGSSIAMNGGGSVLGSVGNNKNSNGELVGSVQLFLDSGAFCGRPTGANKDSMFFTRPACRDQNGSIAKSPGQCSEMYSWQDGGNCQWISELSTAMPSAMPTISSSPSQDPSFSPSSFPSTAPSVSPSTSPSSIPSFSPSNPPSSMPSASPSDSPSTSPSTSPSNEPSATPSDVPSTSPSLSPSTMPSTSTSPSTSPSIEPSSIPSLNPSASPSSLNNNKEKISSNLRHNNDQSGSQVTTSWVVPIFVVLACVVGLGFLIKKMRSHSH